MYRRLIAVVLVSTHLFAATLSSHAESASPINVEREAHEVYQQVLSPFCPGRSLNDCPSSKAQALKDELKARLQAGESKEAILEDVFRTYGEQYRAVPVFSGFGVFVWIVPIGFVLLGLLVAVLVGMGRKKSASATVAPSPAALPDEISQKLQEELSRLD